MKSYIHLIRHGITEGNKKQWYYGWTDLPLLEEGIEELNALREENIYPEIDEDTKIITSGLTRTQQTLETIYGEQEFDIMRELMEWNCGEFECKTYYELKDKYKDYFENESLDTRVPGGESKRELYTRVNEGFDKLVVEHELQMIKLRNRPKDAVTLAVVHGAVISSIMSRLFGDGLEDKNFWTWIPKPGRGYTIIMEDGSIKDYEKI